MNENGDRWRQFLAELGERAVWLARMLEEASPAYGSHRDWPRLVTATVPASEWDRACDLLRSVASPTSILLHRTDPPRGMFFSGDQAISTYLQQCFDGHAEGMTWTSTAGFSERDVFAIVERMTGAWKGTPIVTGDSQSRPASFTRFVLPFAYQLEEVRSNGGPCYVERSPADEARSVVDDWCERLHYMTPETGRVLFQHARWFTLSTDTCQFQFNSHGGPIPVRQLPPQLVLFEGHDAVRKGESASVLGTGFLIVDLDFPVSGDGTPAPTLEDLQLLNERFRYWMCPFESHRSRHEWTMKNAPRNQPSGGGASDAYLARWSNLFAFPVQLRGEGGSRMLFPKEWREEAQRSLLEPLRGPLESGSAEGAPGWIVHADNRTWVWTCAQVEDVGKASLGETSGNWVRFLNIDAPAKDEATEFERHWVRERTYRRWSHLGTLYGFTMHSGAMLSAPVPEPPLWRHFRDIYFDQTLLLLYSRVTTMRFSGQLASQSVALRQPSQKAREEFRGLRGEFAYFTNLYQYPLVSNQQQGIEMYTCARQHLDVGELFDEIEEEFKATHEMIELVEQHEQTLAQEKEASVTTRLTVVGSVGLALGLAMSFLGMNIVANPIPVAFSWVKVREWLIFVTAVLVSGVILGLSARIYAWYDAREEVSRPTVLRMFWVFCVLVTLILGVWSIGYWAWR